MARVTVEDCIDKTETRFELVLAAAQRARKIGTGAPLTIDRDNDKNPVIALREIAAETVSIDTLKEELTKTHQRLVASEDEDDDIDLMDGEEEWERMAQANADSKNDSASNLYGEEEIASEDDKEEENGLATLAGETN